MRDFFLYFFSEWWGILVSVILGAALLILISSLFYKNFFKRLYDIIFSVIALAALSPILIVLTVAGAFAFNGKPFFTQYRPGKNGKIFRLIKFRTMTDAKDEKGEILSDDKRLTKYGKFLRSTSLDELLELINIFVGNMSFVGPRPQLVKDMVFMDENQMKRHSVRQGLTGLAQVSGRNNISWEKKFEYDLEYIKHITLWGDIKILFKTVFKVFARKDISAEGMETAEDLGDYLLKNGKITQEEYDSKILQARELLRSVK